MAITTNDITQKNYKKLSIQVSLSGLSFCVFDLLTNKIITFNNIDFSKNQVIEEQLWKAFTEFPILSEKYDEIKIIHDNSLNAFVPESLFDENFLGSYLQYNVKVFETDLFAFDKLKTDDIYNVYVPYVNINNFLLDQYESFDYVNANSILVDQLLSYSKNTFDKRVYIHFQKEHFEIVAVKSNELLLFNSFEYKTPEDFIYYTLFTLEQLQLNPEICNVFVLGNMNKTDEFFKIGYKFIRNFELLNTNDLSYKWFKTESEIRQHYILLHS